MSTPGDSTTDIHGVTVTAWKEDGPWTSLENITTITAAHHDFTIWSIIDHATAKYVTPIVAGVGTFGNCLCIVVLLSPYFRRVPASMLLIQQSLIDIGYLGLVIFPYLLGSDAFYSLPSGSFLGCVMFTFLKHLFFFLTSWNLVLVSIERFLAVYFPLRMLKTRTRSKVFITWGVMFILAVLYASLDFFSFEKRNDTSESIDQLGYGNCKLKKQFVTLYRILAFVWPVSAFWFPLIIITAANGLILGKIKAASYKGYLFGDTANPKSPNKQFLAKRESTITSLSLLLGLVFFLTNAPLYIVFLLYRSEVISVTTDEDLAIEAMVFTFFETIAMLNNTLNIFLYYLAGKTFRQAVLHLLNICKKPH